MGRRLFNLANRTSYLFYRLKGVLIYKPLFGQFGSRSVVRRPLLIHNPRFIHIGDRVFIRDGVRLEALQDKPDRVPMLKIGDDTTIEQNVHIVCHSRVEIGKGVSITGHCCIVDVTHPYDDVSVPANALTYLLVAGPTNAVIDTNGVISWTPLTSQTPSTNLFTTVVTDFNPWAFNEQNLSATNSFLVFVTAANVPPPPIIIQSIVLTNDVATITWSAAIGYTYRLQYKRDISDTNWNDVVPDVAGTGAAAATTNVVSGSAQRFYRVLLVP